MTDSGFPFNAGHDARGVSVTRLAALLEFVALNALPFADRLADQVHRCGTPLVVGLDPRWEHLPEAVRAGFDPRQEQAEAFRTFCLGIIDVVAGMVPAVKPQAAFFEELGPRGMCVLGEVIDYARDNGLLVILDGKRNDIGSTAEGYARAYLGSGTAWHAHALTVSPYLGDDSLLPFVEQAARTQSAIFVLVKTSNPGGRTFQDLLVDGRPLYRHVAELVEQLAQQTVARCGYGAVGAVVGATYPDQLMELRQAMPHTWFLVPGYGAQGGTAADVRVALDDRGLGAIINSSRAIIFAHARPEYRRLAEQSWQSAVEQATQDAIEQLRG